MVVESVAAMMMMMIMAPITTLAEPGVAAVILSFVDATAVHLGSGTVTHLAVLDALHLQFDIFGSERGALGSDDPVIKGWILSLFTVAGIGILLNVFNAAIRKKMIDQIKLKRMMKETRAWQKEKMKAVRAKNDAKLNELNKKSAYMNKMSMELMQMNLRPMMITFVPLILIFYFVLPWLFSYTVAISPIPLNVIPGEMFQLTCTAEQAADPEHVCTEENAIFLWAWYFLASIAFSGIIMKITKTSMDLN